MHVSAQTGTLERIAGIVDQAYLDTLTVPDRTIRWTQRLTATEPPVERWYRWRDLRALAR